MLVLARFARSHLDKLRLVVSVSVVVVVVVVRVVCVAVAVVVVIGGVKSKRQQVALLHALNS